MTIAEILNCIYKYCLDCSDGSTSALTACNATGCDLYSYRMGEPGDDAVPRKEVLEAVKQCCGICDDYDGICLFEDCELYPASKEL